MKPNQMRRVAHRIAGTHEAGIGDIWKKIKDALGLTPDEMEILSEKKAEFEQEAGAKSFSAQFKEIKEKLERDGVGHAWYLFNDATKLEGKYNTAIKRLFNEMSALFDSLQERGAKDKWLNVVRQSELFTYLDGSPIISGKSDPLFSNEKAEYIKKNYETTATAKELSRRLLDAIENSSENEKLLSDLDKPEILEAMREEKQRADTKREREQRLEDRANKKIERERI